MMIAHTLHFYLIEADQLELAADVDPGRADAENALLLQSVLGVHRSNGHRSGQGRRDNDRDDVQGSHNGLGDGRLNGKEKNAIQGRIILIKKNYSLGVFFL